MSKNEYIKRLKKGLKGLTKNEIDDCIQYYEEYFSDAGEENVDKVIKELGSPESVAKKVSAEACIERIDNGSEKDKKSFANIWILVAAICSAPFWGPIGIAIVAVIFAVMITIFAVTFAIGVTCVALIGSGILSFFVGIVALFASMPDGLLAMGISLIILAIGLLVLIGAVALMRLAVRSVVWILKGLFKKKGGKK